MKQILKMFLFSTLLAMVLFACEKVGPLAVYKNGVSATLQASATTVAPKVVDSLATVLTLTWTDPQYATDAKTVKDRKSTRLNSSHVKRSRMPSSA